MDIVGIQGREIILVRMTMTGRVAFGGAEVLVVSLVEFLPGDLSSMTTPLSLGTSLPYPLPQPPVRPWRFYPGGDRR